MDTFEEEDLQMDNMYLKSQWNQLKGKIREQWGRLTEDDVATIKGDVEQLVGQIQEKYSTDREKAKKEVNDWLSSLKM